MIQKGNLLTLMQKKFIVIITEVRCSEPHDPLVTQVSSSGPNGPLVEYISMHFYGLNLGPPGAGPSWTLGPWFVQTW